MIKSCQVVGNLTTITINVNYKTGKRKLVGAEREVGQPWDFNLLRGSGGGQTQTYNYESKLQLLSIYDKNWKYEIEKNLTGEYPVLCTSSSGDWTGSRNRKFVGAGQPHNYKSWQRALCWLEALSRIHLLRESATNKSFVFHLK